MVDIERVQLFTWRTHLLTQPNYTSPQVLGDLQIQKYNSLGLKPFEPIPRTEDNTDVDYYAVLSIKPDVHLVILVVILGI